MLLLLLPAPPLLQLLSTPIKPPPGCHKPSVTLCCQAVCRACRQGVFDPLIDEVRQPGAAAALGNLDAAALAGHLFDLGACSTARCAPPSALPGLNAGPCLGAQLCCAVL